ncbi:MAG: tetratricopeptide repeat protein [Cyanobacteriota bacterium]
MAERVPTLESVATTSQEARPTPSAGNGPPADRLEELRLLAQHDPQEARRHLLEAYAIDSRQAQVCRAIGKTYLPSREWIRAKLWFEAAAAIDPSYAPPWCDLGLLELGWQQPQAAIALFEQALHRDRGYFPAWGGLATAWAELHQHELCLEAAEEALRLHPLLANLHGLRGVALEQLGRSEEAQLAYTAELAGNPGAIEVLHRLVALLKGQGDVEEAITTLRASLLLRPETAHDALVVAELHLKQGQLTEAESALRRALALAPEAVMASINLSNVLSQAGRHAEAKAMLTEVLARHPLQAEAHLNLGSMLMAEGRLEEAEQAARRALALGANLSLPHQAKAQMNLGCILARRGLPHEAMAALRQAIALDPALADAHYNLGVLLHQTNNFSDAATALEQTLALQGGGKAAFALGHAYRELGREEEKAHAYDLAAELLPGELLPALSCQLSLTQTVIAESSQAIQQARQAYRQGIAAISRADLAQKRSDQIAFANGSFNQFWLGYHNVPDDREILEELATALRSHPTLRPWLEPATPRPVILRQGPVRLGICSEHLLDHHTIGKQNAGLIRGWSQAGLHTVVLSPAAVHQDPAHRAIAASASEAVALPAREEDAAATIRALDLDVLFYPDIGMKPFTYLLALARLAPVQVTSWGHPLTTGSPCMDYYLSSVLLEPEGAEEHYSEQLVCLSRLPCTFGPLDPLPPADLRTFFGMEGHAPSPLPEVPFWIGIPQTLFKFHPDFDATLEAIANALPTAVFVLLEGQRPHWSKALRRRWQQTAPRVLRRAVFLPQLTREHYLQLVDGVDLLLDPFFFGSGNTFYEAMACGTPVVTLPGRAMRGRVVAAAYRQMGVPDAPIASSPDDYVAWCCHLAADPQLRRDLKQRLRQAAARRLFNDTAIHQETLEFFHAATEAARRGETLPPGWRPSPSPFPCSP